MLALSAALHKTTVPRIHAASLIRLCDERWKPGLKTAFALHCFCLRSIRRSLRSAYELSASAISFSRPGAFAMCERHLITRTVVHGGIGMFS
jgi:hypothetical protein